jgi:uncharacterized protein
VHLISILKIILSILLAALLWTITFAIQPFNFWLMMSLSTLILISISFAFNRSIMSRNEINIKNILYGIISAVVLYFIFWAGNHILMFINKNYPQFLPHRIENIQSVYANRGALSPVIVGLLLLFPIGFGEEIFWRGFIQSGLQQRINGLWALMITTILYTLVHLPTGNPVLLLAAFTCGIVWGSLYYALKSVVPVLVSHMLWDVAIFVIFPIHPY